MTKPLWMIRRGTVDPNQMGEVSVRSLRGLSDVHLLQFMAGWEPANWRRLLCEVELRRREGWVARMEAEQRAAARQVCALAVEARSRVREGLLALQAARETARYFQDTLIPLREQIVSQSQLHYNGMLLGLYQLISARQASLETRREAISAQRDYWMARFEIENALGGALPLEQAAK